MLKKVLKYQRNNKIPSKSSQVLLRKKVIRTNQKMILKNHKHLKYKELLNKKWK